MKNYTEEERRVHLENWKSGGLSKAAYAKSAGIYTTTFYTWTRGQASKEKQNFVEINKRLIQKANNDLVIEKGNITIRVPMPALEKELQAVFAALEGTK